MDLQTQVLDGNNAQVANTPTGSTLPFGKTSGGEYFLKVGGPTGSGNASGGIPVISSAPTVTPTAQNMGASATVSIPLGSKGWTFTVLTGTGGIAGTTLLPAGFSDSDPNTVAAAFNVTTAAASSAYVRYNT